MKICIIQPAYSKDYTDSQKCFDDQLALIDQCDESMDLIVLPESCDIPALAATRAESMASAAKFLPILLEKVSQTAKRCNAMVFVNAPQYIGAQKLRHQIFKIFHFTFPFQNNDRLCKHYSIKKTKYQDEKKKIPQSC